MSKGGVEIQKKRDVLYEHCLPCQLIPSIIPVQGDQMEKCKEKFFFLITVIVAFSIYYVGVTQRNPIRFMKISRQSLPGD